MKIRNLTPHTVRLVRSGGKSLVVPSEGEVRVEIVRETDGFADGVEIYRMRYRMAGTLPRSEEGTLLIVSRHVAEAFPMRRDLVFPGGKQSTRKWVKEGVIRCKGLQRLPVRGVEGKAAKVMRIPDPRPSQKRERGWGATLGERITAGRGR